MVVYFMDYQNDTDEDQMDKNKDLGKEIIYSMTIMDMIRSWMKEEGLTYEELAKLIGWTKQNLWMKMNKTEYPNFDTVRKIVEALGYEIQFEMMDNNPVGNVNLQELYKTTEEQQVSFDVVKDLINAMGYEVKFVKTKNVTKF